MTVSLFDVSVPVFTRGLQQLHHILDKALAHAKSDGGNPQALLESRLAPDMLPFTKQIQIACDAAKFGVARVAGVESPSFPDDETTLEQLQARVAKTLDFVKTLERAALDGQEARPVTVKTRNGELHFTAQNYLLQFALPNFYFHMVTAYGLLRQGGVSIGKMDFLGKPADPAV